MTDVENSDVMIELEDLTKMYPGQPVPAVDHVNMRIPRGEIVVLVGPSGCGKTTTMKMVNRLIEPTSGRIVLDGEDVTKVNANQLRRRIGYVIQQIGLFPHQTIKQNIATVPKVLGWDKDRIDHRVDELLRTVGMDPEQFRDRYPKELSGGQRQRVGVARAMSVDPDVMLMDEPFGAIDPITRERLQNEFLRVQAEIRKTIIFVTHDIDEAIKMGDRIAILQEQSHIAQFAPPEEILTAPANDFVADFIGSGASLKRLNLTRIRDIQLHADAPVVDMNDDITTARQRLRDSDWTALLVVDAERRPQRWLRPTDLKRPSADLHQGGLPVDATVEPQATLADALNEMIISNAGCVVVTDGRGAYQGVADIDTIMASIRAMRAQVDEYYRAAKLLDIEGEVAV
ncbi:MAG: betaine/proline/choline family ABC transporter ATP-binding protein [Actinomycetota bacterium]|nr:betaine/proline/choline family ABC transporter ATP-binding protein [Actinomycetota bacterium]